MKELCRRALILLCFASPALAERITVDPSASDLGVRVLESTAERVLIEVTIASFDRARVRIDGDEYYRVSLRGGTPILAAGLPDLPRICRSIIVPDDRRVEVTLVDSRFEEYDAFPVAPSKGNIERTVSPSDVPYTFDPFYDGDEWFPREPVTEGTPYILRDFRGLCLSIQPFRYNPATRTLRVLTRMVIEVEAVGPGEINVLENARRSGLHFAFRGIYEDRFLNFRDDDYAPVSEAGDMLVITYDPLRDDLEDLVDWKNRMGIRTTVVDVSAIGNDTTAIRSFIRDFYDSTDLAFVLLVGDDAQVATPFAYDKAADPKYALVAGDDGYPDVFIGRFSAQASGQLETQVRRTVEYERDAASGDDWFDRAMGIASDDGPGDDEEYDFEHMDIIRNKLLGFTYSAMDQIYDPGATADEVTSGLNEGRGLLAYCGHGSATGWGTTAFSNSDVLALSNFGRLPFILDVACSNGDFTGRLCFAEAWLRARTGSEPAGAVAMYASSINQYWDPPMAAQDESIDLLVDGEKRTFGGLCYDGSCRMIDEYGLSGEKMFNSWHIFGDPSLRVRTGDPVPLAVDHAGIIDRTATHFTVSVGGATDALCALSNDGNLLGAAFTDEGGVAVIPVEGPIESGDLLDLTVTAFNAAAYLSEIDVVPHPTCDVSPTAVDVLLTPGGTQTVEVILANNGEANSSLAYDIDVTAAMEKNIDGSTFTCDLTGFDPGSSFDMQLAITNATSDYEWIRGATIDFPAGVTVDSSTDFEIPGTSRRLITNGAAGDGAEVEWEAPGAWGEIHVGDIALATVHVTVEPDFLDTMVLHWTMSGDGWGDPPHVLYGDLDLPPSGPTILVTAPNGGEVWDAGENHAITWGSTGDLGDVSIFYSTNSGSSWRPVAPETADDGTFDWVVPNDPSVYCLVEIRQIGGNATDVSDGVFRIVEPVTWLSVTPDTGTVAQGEADTIRLELDAGAVLPGDHEALVIIANSAGDPVPVPVMMHVSSAAIDPDSCSIVSNDDLFFVPGGDADSTLRVTVTVRDGYGSPVEDLPAGEVVIHASGVSSIGEGVVFCETGLANAVFYSTTPTDGEGRTTIEIGDIGGCGVITSTAEVGDLALPGQATADFLGPDFNGDGKVDYLDTFVFLPLLNAGSGTCGNLNGDPENRVDFSDTTIFLLYLADEASCP